MSLAWGESGVGPREFSRRPLAPGDELREVPVLAPVSEEFRLMRPLGILRAARSVAYRAWLRLLLRCPMEAPMVVFFSIAALTIFFAGVMAGHAFAAQALCGHRDVQAPAGGLNGFSIATKPRRAPCTLVYGRVCHGGSPTFIDSFGASRRDK